MSMAKKAIDNSVKLEVKKDGLQQRQGGDWKVGFTVAALDMQQKQASILINAAMGTRFVCVLVEISDNEEPVDHAAHVRDKWRDLGPTKQAGIRCGEKAFWAFLTEELQFPCFSEQAAAERVRNICGVSSRRDLAKPGFNEERLKWYEIDNAYQAWLITDA